MDYAGLGPPQLIPATALRSAWRFARRALVLASAVVIAVVISGGIFTLTPIVGLRIAHTSGISMEPVHKEGDVVLIKNVDVRDLHVGDIVVFEALGQQIMHRIVEKRVGPDGELIFVTQGDNVAWPDFPIRATQINGKLVSEIPLLGPLSRLIDADGGFYVYRSIILTLAVTVVAVWGLATSARQRSERANAERLAISEDETGPKRD